jgi:hypothetical protein
MTRFDDLDVVVRKRGNVAYAGIPQLGIYMRGDDAAAALAKLEQWKSDLAKDPGEMEFVAELARAGGAAKVTRSAWRSIGLFAAKTAIVMVLLVGAIVVSSALVATRVERTIERAQTAIEPFAAKLSGKQFWAKIQTEIGNAAKSSNEIPESERRELMANLRILANRWRPIATEAAAILLNAESENPKARGAN